MEITHFSSFTVEQHPQVSEKWGNIDSCSASDATDSKKWCGERVGTKQQSFDAKHGQYKQSKVEIQARDISDIAPYPSPMYHMLKRLNQLRFKWYFRMREYSLPVKCYLIHGSANAVPPLPAIYIP